MQPTIFCYAGNQRSEERALSNNASIYRYFYDTPGSDMISYRQTTSTGGRLYYLYDDDDQRQQQESPFGGNPAIVSTGLPPIGSHIPVLTTLITACLKP